MPSRRNRRSSLKTPSREAISREVSADVINLISLGIFLFEPIGLKSLSSIKRPKSKRALANERLTGLIKQFWLESGAVYGYRKIFSDLREYGEHCGEARVYRLMRAAGLRAQIGYRRPRHRSGQAHVVVPNRLQRQFNPGTPDEAWVTDITHIRTHEGWLYLAVVLDLFS